MAHGKCRINGVVLKYSFALLLQNYYCLIYRSLIIKSFVKVIAQIGPFFPLWMKNLKSFTALEVKKNDGEIQFAIKATFLLAILINKQPLHCRLYSVEQSRTSNTGKNLMCHMSRNLSSAPKMQKRSPVKLPELNNHMVLKLIS